MNPFDILMAAKAARDTVRNTLIKALRAMPDPSAELVALLRAEDLATEELAQALKDL